MTNRYVQAARQKFACDCDVDVLDIVDESPDDGAWVTALIWVYDDDLEPEPGPTYDVWIAEQSQGDLAPGGCFPGPWVWSHSGMTFTCDDDPDGRGARRAAHDHARHLRSTYPCAFVAVRAANKGLPLPVTEKCE